MPSHLSHGQSIEPTFIAKIPDIQTNLDVAQHWMAVTSSPSVAFFKQWETSMDAPSTEAPTFQVATPSSSPPPMGAAAVQASVGNATPAASNDTTTAVHDAPLYYDCGLVMNTAWGALARDPCSWASWTASHKMKAVAPECSTLRHGEAYMASYKALKLDQDTWCGFPECKVRGDGKTCLKCLRSGEFPFEPQCMDNVPKNLTHSKARACTAVGVVHFAALLGLSAW